MLPSIDLRDERGAGPDWLCSSRWEADVGVDSTDGAAFFLGVEGIGGGA